MLSVEVNQVAILIAGQALEYEALARLLTR